MGGIFSSFQATLASYFVRHVRVVMVGLDGAGKTSILYRLKLGAPVQTIPTIGFNVEDVERGRTRFHVHDVGCRTKGRSLWVHYFKDTEVLIFVVDSCDRERISEAEYEFSWVMAEDHLCDALFLILANKQDLSGAMTPQEVAEKMRLHACKRTWHIQGCSAVTGQGLEEALGWISSQLNKT